MHQFPTFYANILQSWKRNFSHISYTPSCIGSQFLWFNNYITIDNNSVHFKEFSSHNINLINELFTSEGEFKDWNHIKREFQLTNNLYYKFTQISHAIPKKWKQILRENGAKTCVIYLDHHLIKNNLLLSLEKLTSKELYSILISKKTSIPTSQQYFNSLFPDSNLDWKLIYLLPREISRSTSCRAFQYKILKNVLYLNKMLFRFGKTPSPLCSFCKLHDETLIHLFSSCNQVISLWIEIKLFFSEYI